VRSATELLVRHRQPPNVAVEIDVLEQTVQRPLGFSREIMNCALRECLASRSARLFTSAWAVLIPNRSRVLTSPPQNNLLNIGPEPTGGTRHRDGGSGELLETIDACIKYDYHSTTRDNATVGERGIVNSMDLAARVRRLEDRAELQELVIRYFLAADDDDVSSLEATFVPEAEFVASGSLCGSDRDSIVRFIREDRLNMGVTVHTPNYLLLRFTDDDHASGTVGAHLELARGGTTLYGAVRYFDDYARTERGWCFTRRELATIHVGDWRDVATSLTTELRVRWPEQDPSPADLPR
jgi:hypothetical protein